MAETPKTPRKPAPLNASAPKVPGVAPPKPKKPTPPRPIAKTSAPVAASQQKAPGYLWAIGIVVLLVFVVGCIWLIGGSKQQTSSLASVNASAPAAKPSLVVNSAKLPVAPGMIATTDELAQPWSAKKFLFRNAKGKSISAMVVRLPDNSYWAFALREPYGSCELEYVTDLDKLGSEYNFSATHPMVVNPCSHTVFDLGQYGSGPSGEVRGEIVAGTGVRPPLAIEVEVNGTNIFATRTEADIMQ